VSNGVGKLFRKEFPVAEEEVEKSRKRRPI